MLKMLKMLSSRNVSVEKEKVKDSKSGDSKIDFPAFAFDEPEEDEKARPLYLNEMLQKLVAEEEMSDVTFIVGTGRKQRKVPAHRIVLAASSPLFEAMLYRPDIPMTDEDFEIVIPNEDPEIFQLLLHCIYTDKVDVNPATIQPLLEIAKKYQIEKMQSICSDFMSHDINVDNACELFQLSPNVAGGKDVALEFILDNAEEVFDSKGFLNLSRDRLLMIARNDALGVDEVTLFNAVLRWGQAELKRQGQENNPANMRKLLRDFLPHIRFPLMTVPELAGEVAPSELLSDEQLLAVFQYSAIRDEKDKARVNPGFTTRTRAAGGITKETRLLDRKFKKEFLEMFGKDVVNLKLELLYRGSRDGFLASAFHSKCDNKGATLTVVKAQGSNYVFGGYTAGNWTSSMGYSSAETWLFSLHNGTGKPFKLSSSNPSYNFYNNSSFGPTFGGTGTGIYDLHIASTMRSAINHSTPSTYRVAAGYNGSFGKNSLAGSDKFTVEEIEVFAVREVVKKK